MGAGHYLLTCYRYIELNPVRAGMVQRPDGYRWSSHRHNALGETDAAITAHPAYVALGAHAQARQDAYRSLFAGTLHHTDDDALRAHTRQNRAFGNDRFRAAIQALIGRSVEVRPRGRPKAAGK